MNDQREEPVRPEGDSSVGERNIERLLSRAYSPEGPDAAFAGRVEAAMIEAARREAQTRKRQAPLRRLGAWLTGPRGRWVALAAAAGVLIAVAVTFTYRPPHTSGPAEKAAAPAAAPSIVQPIVRTPTKVEPFRVGSRLTPRPGPAEVQPIALAAGTAVQTRPGERRRVALADGSIVYVDQATTLEVVGPRELLVRAGRAYVEVAPSTQAGTFVVRTPDRRIAAAGTHFAVRVEGGQTAVFVTQGKVRVSGLDGLLYAGQQLRPDAAVVSPMPRATYLLDWTRELLAASRTPLVPASEHAGGALVAVDPQGQQVHLSLRKYHVDVHVEDGFARTTIDQTYFNHSSWRMEGTFYFPLPPDASLSRLAMYVSGKLNEGGMVERGRARQVYESIVNTMKDPALLEWVDGTTFKMRVFPLEGRQEKRIILSYTQKLPMLYGQATYRFPAGHSLATVGRWSFHARVKNAGGLGWQCDSHKLIDREERNDLLLDAAGKDVKCDTDVVVFLRDLRAGAGAAEDARFATADFEGGRYLMVRYRPDLPSAQRRQRRHWVFLFESSADRDPLLGRTQIEIVRGILDSAEHDDTFNVVAAGTRAKVFSPRALPATRANVEAAVEFLDHTHLIGALDLDQALGVAGEQLAAGPNAHLVHLGSAQAVLGRRDADSLLARIPAGAKYVGVGVGKRWDRAFMKAAATRTGGYLTQINPDEQIAWRAMELVATLNTPRLLNVRVAGAVGGEALLTTADAVAHGEEICAILRVPSDRPLPEAVTVAGLLDGKAHSAVLPVRDVSPNAGCLPRIWARLEIDRLLAEDRAANRQRIVELSKAMYVMSPFTSLLVLENEDMYRQYQVDRGRKDHWALYPCPETIPVVSEPWDESAATDRPGARRPPAPAAAPAKPWQQKVLETILVRTPQPFFEARDANTSAPRAWGHSIPGRTAWQTRFGAYAVPVWLTERTDGSTVRWDERSFLDDVQTDFLRRTVGSTTFEDYVTSDLNGAYGGFFYDLNTTVIVPDGGTLLLGGQRVDWTDGASWTYAPLITVTHGRGTRWPAVGLNIAGGPDALVAATFDKSWSGEVSTISGVPILGRIPILARSYTNRASIGAGDSSLTLIPPATKLPPDELVDLSQPPTPWYAYLRYPKNWRALTQERKEFQASAAGEPPADAELRRRLARTLPQLSLHETALRDAVQILREASGANIHVNWRALTAAGVDPGTKVNADVRNVSVKRALELLLRDVSGSAAGADAEAAYALDGGVLTISTKTDLAREPIRRVYDIRDLLGLSQAGPPPRARARLSAAQPLEAEQRRRAKAILVDRLLHLLQSSVDRDSWSDPEAGGGGAGSVRVLGDRLVVTQTPENQEAVGELLRELRAPAKGSDANVPPPPGEKQSDEDAAVRQGLQRKVDKIHFAGAELKDVMQFLREYTGANLYVNWRALQAAGLEKTTKVDVGEIRDVTAGRALELVLRDVNGLAAGADAGLNYTIDRGVLTVSTRADLARETVRRVYDVGDLIEPGPDFYDRRLDPRYLEALANSQGFFGGGIFDEEDAVSGGGLFEDRSGSFFGGSFGGDDNGDAFDPTGETVRLVGVRDGQDLTVQERGDDLVDLVKAGDRDSWSDPEAGGGAVGFVQILNGQLVVTQTVEGHRKVAELIEQLRRSRSGRASEAAPSPLPYRCPAFTGFGRYFDDLTLYAPGLNTTEADVQAALEAEAPPEARARRGRIDPAARRLIDAARSAGWQTITLGPDASGKPLAITFDGTGRCAYKRAVSGGLVEHVVCDGRTLLHLYAEIGLGARRTVSRFHRAKLLAVVPWLLPPADDLAVGAELACLDSHTVTVMPLEPADPNAASPPARAVHLTFAADGRLAEGRVVQGPGGTLLFRETYDPNGAVHIFDGAGKLLSRRKCDVHPAAEPDLAPDLSGYIILPLPIRTGEYVLRTRKLDVARTAAWSAEDVLAYLPAGIATSDDARRTAAKVIRERFLDTGDRRMGLYVLLAAAGAKPEVPPDLLQTPAGMYLAELAKPGPTADFRAFAAGGREGLTARLGGFRDLWRRLGGEEFKKTADARTAWQKDVLDYARQAGPSIFSWALLAEIIAQRPVPAARDSLAGCLADHGRLPGLSYVARYEAARAVFDYGPVSAAAEQFRELYVDALDRGVLEPIDETFYHALRPNGIWAAVVHRTATLFAERRAVRPAITFAWQCYHLGDFAAGAEVFDAILATVDDRQREALKLAAVKYHCHTNRWSRAAALLEEVLADERMAKVPALWHAASRIAAKRGRIAEAATCLDRAMDLEYRELGEKVDVAKLRGDYGRLLGRYRRLAQGIATLQPGPPGELLAGIIRAADRWRYLDGEPTRACQAAAKALRELGQDELAWEYLTTPLADKPSEPGAWLALAEELQRDGEVDLADRAYAAAAQTEPDNASILWDRARLLQRHGRSAEAAQLFRRIAEGTWPEKFSEIKSKAALHVGQ